MKNMTTDLAEKQRVRYQLLAKLYELSDGSRRNRVRVEDLMKESAIDRKDFYHVLQYLTDEGLASKSNLVVSLTHEGIVEFEDSLRSPTESTTHFPAPVIQHFHGPVGAVQTGAQSITNVTQKVLADTAESDDDQQESETINFIDWCTRILNLLIAEGDKDPYTRTEGVDEYELLRVLFDVEAIHDFHNSPQRMGTLEALTELAKLGLLEQDSHFWKVTIDGREAAGQIERLWEELFVAKPSNEEERILMVVNRLGEVRGNDYASIEFVHHTRLLPELGESDVMRVLWPISEDLEARGLVERDALAGPNLDLKPTYKGLVWERKQKLLGQPVIGHVLFLDIVGYSKLAMDDQATIIERLEELVRGTTTFREAKQTKNLISLATGDGLALVFFDGITRHFDCALELHRILEGKNDLPIRIGLNTGPVYRRVDINTNMNVAGSGINIAQRVMDCGDAGHILMTRRVADFLIEMGKPQEHIHDLGEVVVKHGEKIHLFSFYDSSIGNPKAPTKIQVSPTHPT